MCNPRDIMAHRHLSRSTLLALVIIAGLVHGVAVAAILRVPSQTIAQALNLANDGDTILIADGVYTEHDLIITKNVTIRSVTGPGDCVLDVNHAGRGFLVNNPGATNVNIIGLTIQNAQTPYREGGGALRLEAGRCRISKCIVEGTRGAADYSGSPIHNSTGTVGDLIVEDCIVRNNFAANGAGIGQATVYNCWIYNNTGGNNAMALVECVAVNCTVYGNGGGFLTNPWTVGGGSGGTWTNCIVWNNLPSYADQQLYSPGSVSYCIVQGGFPGLSNLDSDPLFVAPLSGDFSLRSNSPALSYGDPSITKYAYVGGLPDLSMPPIPNPVPHRAIAMVQVVNGFVVGITIADPGFGYTNAPIVKILDGTGTGAAAKATVANGIVSQIQVTNAGNGYSRDSAVLIASPPFSPWLDCLVKRVQVNLHVVLGRSYILEASPDFRVWTTVEPRFTAEDEVVEQEFDVVETGRYFRITEVP